MLLGKEKQGRTKKTFLPMGLRRNKKPKKGPPAVPFFLKRNLRAKGRSKERRGGVATPCIWSKKRGNFVREGEKKDIRPTYLDAPVMKKREQKKKTRVLGVCLGTPRKKPLTRGGGKPGEGKAVKKRS